MGSPKDAARIVWGCQKDLVRMQRGCSEDAAQGIPSAVYTCATRLPRSLSLPWTWRGEARRTWWDSALTKGLRTRYCPVRSMAPQVGIRTPPGSRRTRRVTCDRSATGPGARHPVGVGRGTPVPRGCSRGQVAGCLARSRGDVGAARRARRAGGDPWGTQGAEGGPRADPGQPVAERTPPPSGRDRARPRNGASYACTQLVG